MTFQEKGAWACLLSIVVVFVPYFVNVFQRPMTFAGLFILAVFAQVVILVTFHIINALASKRIRQSGQTPEPDEMEASIELNAAKFAGSILGVIVLLACIGGMYGVPGLGVANLASLGDAAQADDFAVPVQDMLRFVHLLFAGFVFANLCYYARIIIGYRSIGRG